MLYQIIDGTVSAGGRQILSHIHFEIKGKEKAGLIGRNGAGKTTLLRLIAGEITPDRDDKREGAAVRTDRKLTYGLLSQTQEKDQEKTVEELILENCPEGDSFSELRYEFELEYDRVFTGLGFTKKDKKKKLGEFSGGEQTKIALIRSEDQALLAGIRAVPEKEKHRLREIGTEEAYRDWQMRLRAEEMEAAEENVREEAARLEILEEEQARAGDYGKDTEESTVSRKTLSELEERWTEACLAWYDALLYG